MSGSDDETLVTLTMTVPQAEATIESLDLLSRLGLGQVEEIGLLIRRGTVVPRLPKGLGSEEAKARTHAVGEEIGLLLDGVKALLGHPANGSFGIGSTEVSDVAKRAYEIRKVLERAVAVHRNPSPTMPTTNYDGLLFRVTGDPEPTASTTALRPGR